jgi:sialic acid synthase SpsE
VVADIKAGEIFSEKNIRSIRPAYGMAPKKLKDVLGRVAKRDYRRGDPLVI